MKTHSMKFDLENNAKADQKLMSEVERRRKAEPFRSISTDMGKADIKVYVDENDLLLNILVKGLRERNRTEIYRLGVNIESVFRENPIPGVDVTVDFFFDFMAYSVRMISLAKRPNMKYFVDERLKGIVDKAIRI